LVGLVGRTATLRQIFAQCSNRNAVAKLPATGSLDEGRPVTGACVVSRNSLAMMATATVTGKTAGILNCGSYVSIQA
jgi:hypothetical protein